MTFSVRSPSRPLIDHGSIRNLDDTPKTPTPLTTSRRVNERNFPVMQEVDPTTVWILTHTHSYYFFDQTGPRWNPTPTTRKDKTLRQTSHDQSTPLLTRVLTSLHRRHDWIRKESLDSRKKELESHQRTLEQKLTFVCHWENGRRSISKPNLFKDNWTTQNPTLFRLLLPSQSPSPARYRNGSP